MGEQFVRSYCSNYLIIISSSLFGFVGSEGKGTNFVETMIQWAKSSTLISVVNDQVVSPTYIRDLSSTLTQMIKLNINGLYNVTNTGMCSCYEFAKEIFALLGLNPEMIPISSEELKLAAKRPTYSAFSNSLLLSQKIPPLPSYKDTLVCYLLEKGHLSA